MIFDFKWKFIRVAAVSLVKAAKRFESLSSCNDAFHSWFHSRALVTQKFLCAVTTFSLWSNSSARIDIDNRRLRVIEQRFQSLRLQSQQSPFYNADVTNWMVPHENLRSAAGKMAFHANSTRRIGNCRDSTVADWFFGRSDHRSAIIDCALEAVPRSSD